MVETVSCDFCGSLDYKIYLQSKDYINKLEGIFSVVRCDKCGLIFTNPRPDKTEILEFYPPSTHYYNLNEDDLKQMKVVSGIYPVLLQYFKGYFPEKASSFFYRILLYPIYLVKKHKFDAEAIPYYIKGGKLLEIGCSHGKFLKEMKKLGWYVNGIEMNRDAVAVGKNLFGLDLISRDIDDVEFEANCYDVIIMRMVLEHVYLPGKVLEKVSDWLKPKGQLIITVPDISSVEAKLFGKYFYSLHLPNHLYHFSPETIKMWLFA